MIRLKTVQYAFPVLATLVNNTLTNVPIMTVHLPESGTKTIRKAWVEVSMDDAITVGGGSVNTSTINLRLGAAGYTSTTNAHSKADTGENISWAFTRDFTSHFTTNWTGTSMTCDVQVQTNQTTGTTHGMRNVCVMLYVTYEYDDTSTTQLKTVLIPLDAPRTFLPTTKTSHDTIPVLDTYLPEASKTYRNISIVMLSNTLSNSTTDFSVSMELSALGVQTTQLYEQGLNSDRHVRYIWNVTSLITTNVTHTFNLWASLTGTMDCPMTYMVVTYEYDDSTSTSIMNSMQLPMEIASPMGGNLAANFQRSNREVWVQETNPVRQRLAFYMFWQNATNDAGLNARIGTGAFLAYTQAGSQVVCGNKSLMIRNDAPTDVPFARGRNNLQMDCYNTSVTARGGNVGGFWILNYTSDKHSSGSGAHNHTVLYPMFTQGTANTTQSYLTTADAPSIPEANYFLSSVGYHFNFMQRLTQQGVAIKAERTVAEGGLVFERIYAAVSQHDNEMGVYNVWCQARSLFLRWTGDTDASRLNIETARRYIMHSSNSVTGANHLVMMLNYHTISFTVAGDITDSNGGTVTISLHREATGEKILETSRVGNGAYSLTWYDDTEEVFVSAYEDSDHVGRSDNDLAV